MTSPRAVRCSRRYPPPGKRGGRGVMTVMDDINRRWGRGTLRYSGGRAWVSRGACAGNGCRRLIRRGGGSCWGWGEGGNRLAGSTWRGGLGELLGIVREERDVAATGRHFQSRPVENPDVTPYIVDQAALLERTRSEGDAAPAHPQQGGQHFMG
jgi:hypothetical protein